MITLAIDAMGGDRGLEVTIPAALQIGKRHKEVRQILVGDRARIDAQLSVAGAHTGERLQIQQADQIVAMDESPAQALRKKKNSSMRVALDLVQSGRADACVSAGNTGALLATARFVLKTIAGIDRPAICVGLPRIDGNTTYVLDMGANIDSPAEILFQFGVMGATLVHCLADKPRPSVGLLNIGVEDVKGGDTIRAAAQLFKQSALNYVGYVEADDIYVGGTDLVVCDGFVGNAALKASEGVAQLIMTVLKEEFTRDLATRARALVAKPVLDAIKQRLDHRRYNGASLLGLRGTVVKSHGGADVLGFGCALEVGIAEAQQGLVRRIERALTQSPEAMLERSAQSKSQSESESESQTDSQTESQDDSKATAPRASVQ